MSNKDREVFVVLENHLIKALENLLAELEEFIMFSDRCRDGLDKALSRTVYLAYVLREVTGNPVYSYLLMFVLLYSQKYSNIWNINDESIIKGEIYL